MISIRQYDKVSAIFKPQRTDDLKPGAAAMIGKRFTFTADWTIDEGYPYEGDWHMSLSEEDWKRTEIFWVPLCDLADIELFDEHKCPDGYEISVVRRMRSGRRLKNDE